MIKNNNSNNNNNNNSNNNSNNNNNKRNLSMGWVDAKKAYDSTDHGWVKAMMLMYRFPTWLCRAIQNLSRSWSTRIVTTTRKGREVSDTTRFRKGLPPGDALYPRLFTVCLNPIAWDNGSGH